VSQTERDPVTGQITTGHEWNGIKELNSPVPKIVFAALALGAVYLAISTLLLPAWPGITGYWRGLLGVDQRDTVTRDVAQARMERSVWTAAIDAQSFDDILADAALMDIVRSAGGTLFADNCAACHGQTGAGNVGFPNIAQASMLWGDDLDTVHETIRVGINSNHPETRFGQMLAFGRDGMLSREDVNAVADYVLSLSDPAGTAPDPVGAEVFAFNCASCHGDDARGIADFGAPDLTDPFWIYGGTRAQVRASIYGGRVGHMPHWEGRLSATDIRVLALYVHDLRANAP
jgi:cytochrome c oxidase cbb3-type subunit 3